MSHVYYAAPPTHSAYIHHNSYYAATAPAHLTHVVAAQGQRPDASATQQRKRPKYTRSKTGCLTCRVKKIKCDETKPKCQRCSHGQRECTWPDGVPSRKKPGSRRDQKSQQDTPQSSESPVMETRPSTATSSVSDGSTPPTRDHTPPVLNKREPAEQGLPPLVSRRHTDSVSLTSVGSDSDASRRQQQHQQTSHGYPTHAHPSTTGLSEMSAASSYAQQSQASYAYPPSSSTASHYTTAPVAGHHHPQSLVLPRVTSQHEVMRAAAGHHHHHGGSADGSGSSGQWSTSAAAAGVVSPHVEASEHYYSNIQAERTLVAQHHQARY